MKTPRQIMVVDDSAVDCLIAKKTIALLDAQVTVRTFQMASEALVYLTTADADEPGNRLPDLILLDINMPSMDGWGFLAEFMKLPIRVVHHCRVAILSSSEDERDRVKASHYPVVTDFITKPLTPDVLVQRGIISGR